MKAYKYSRSNAQTANKTSVGFERTDIKVMLIEIRKELEKALEAVRGTEE